MTNVLCVWVRGNVPYSAEYVTRLRSMVRRHLAKPHRFVCLTDQPSLLSDVETRLVEPTVGIPGWWSKIELFNPRHELRGRSVYLDLDSLVVRALDEIVEYSSRLSLVPTAGNWRGRDGLQVVRRYNSSVMVWEESSETRALYEQWSPKVGERLWGDQDWIGEQLPDLDTMPLEWFPRLSELETQSQIPENARVVLCKKPKNHVAATEWPWFDRMWG